MKNICKLFNVTQNLKYIKQTNFPDVMYKTKYKLFLHDNLLNVYKYNIMVIQIS